jgi:hypothetical protein
VLDQPNRDALARRTNHHAGLPADFLLVSSSARPAAITALRTAAVPSSGTQQGKTFWEFTLVDVRHVADPDGDEAHVVGWLKNERHPVPLHR